ncbi:RNA-directed DNA polymerase [Bradyrhizobium sp. CB2312]|uniref:RNA-directed DNA polymerase n=1 Tax=Bradyrhizobium sp. CB2312 TaxID=3039155 RepID=UPI0024B236BE|nr:RNA-directed DNA polymerase [Bradyrhizobium sp. CB2312]WFU73831.1 RNA-directed DNA polymerase [Bradyrhizobium sp. CB2312]
MAGFSQVFDQGNLLRAYRWILSNPEPFFKGHFRAAYSDYALSSEANLKFLKRQISQERFTPTPASKLYLPKTSGILRPISLLTVNDQIAYQAVANLVAEAVFRKTRARYRTNVFQHLYAGKSSRFFYLKWQDSYRAYASYVRSYYHAGYQYVASFDLTAFYDTIDHHVLRTLLRDLRIDHDTVDFLMRCLREWTCATWSDGRKPIYHEHGIPQGPLSSGIISEVVLRHIDDAGLRSVRDIRYLRYVDDIKITAKSEDALRRRLVTLDLAAKEIGLFPQSSKIAIRKISDPAEEIKSVSQPPEPSVLRGSSQETIRRRVQLLANRGIPTDVTRFRYVLASLAPSAKTNGVLLKVLRRQPQLSDTLIRHWGKYKKLPIKLSQALIDLVLQSEIYHAVNAMILDLLLGRVNTSQELVLSTFAYERLFAGRYRSSSIARPQPTYKVALARWALLSGRMTYRDFETLLFSERDWWVRQGMLHHLDSAKFGNPGYAALLNASMRVDNDPDFSRAGAALLFQSTLPLTKPYDDCALSARLLLRATKIIPKAGRAPSLIGPILAYVLGVPKTPYDWQRFFGPDHAAAEQIAIKAKQRFETDIDACVVSIDSFCDAAMRKIYQKRGLIMPAYGAAVGASSPAWLRALPLLKDGLYELHQLRIKSFTAHPVHTKTGTANTRIKHSQFYRVRKLLVAAFRQLEASIVP